MLAFPHRIVIDRGARSTWHRDDRSCVAEVRTFAQLIQARQFRVVIELDSHTRMRSRLNGEVPSQCQAGRRVRSRYSSSDAAPRGQRSHRTQHPLQ